MAAGLLKVTQIGSPIGRHRSQRATLIGLGLNKLHRSRVWPDTAAVRGRLDKVRHLVRVEAAAAAEVERPAAAAPSPVGPATTPDAAPATTPVAEPPSDADVADGDGGDTSGP